MFMASLLVSHLTEVNESIGLSFNNILMANSSVQVGPAYHSTPVTLVGLFLIGLPTIFGLAGLSFVSYQNLKKDKKEKLAEKDSMEDSEVLRTIELQSSLFTSDSFDEELEKQHCTNTEKGLPDTNPSTRTSSVAADNSPKYSTSINTTSPYFTFQAWLPASIMTACQDEAATPNHDANPSDNSNSKFMSGVTPAIFMQLPTSLSMMLSQSSGDFQDIEGGIGISSPPAPGSSGSSIAASVSPSTLSVPIREKNVNLLASLFGWLGSPSTDDSTTTGITDKKENAPLTTPTKSHHRIELIKTYEHEEDDDDDDNEDEDEDDNKTKTAARRRGGGTDLVEPMASSSESESGDHGNNPDDDDDEDDHSSSSDESTVIGSGHNRKGSQKKKAKKKVIVKSEKKRKNRGYDEVESNNITADRRHNRNRSLSYTLRL